MVVLSACGEPTVASRRAVLSDAHTAVVGPQASPPTWTTTVLGALPGNNFSIAYDISDTGIVVGQSQQSSSVLLPFYWIQAGGMKQLAVPIHATSAVARAISDNGAYITGSVTLGDGRKVPARWRWSGGNSVVTLIGCASSSGYSGSGWGVNDVGTVVGASNGAAWRWLFGSNCSSPIVIDGVTMSDANGINNLGLIVGRGWSPRRGYIYAGSPQLNKQFLPASGHSESWAHAISDAHPKLTVGTSSVSSGFGSPVYWNASGVPPALVLAPSNWLYGFVAVSDKWRIVWSTQTGGMSRKGTTTWALNIFPHGVNACGDIVGKSTNAVAVLMKKLVCD
ncbi:MAG: hypothetical protein ACT4P6_14095 [Gemmatimonadaceae bacterium]